VLKTLLVLTVAVGAAAFKSEEVRMGLGMVVKGAVKEVLAAKALLEDNLDEQDNLDEPGIDGQPSYASEAPFYGNGPA
jgi:hypothetical protein